MRGERVTMTTTSELRRRRASSEQRDGQGVPGNTLRMISSYELEPLSPPTEVERNDMTSISWWINLERNTLNFMWHQGLYLKHLYCIDLSGCIKILPNSTSETLKYFELEPLLPSGVQRNDMMSKLWRINLVRNRIYAWCDDLLYRSMYDDRPPSSQILLRRRREVDDFYKKQIRIIEGHDEVKAMIETGCAPGNAAEDEMKQPERMAILVTIIASIVLFALKVFASIESKSFSIIASILDPFFDLLWEFILWLTSHAMQNPNPHKYPIGKKRMQPVGMIVFGSFGLQLLFLAAKQFITKSEPEKDPQKEKWMIGVMTFVTMVQFMLTFYCRRFENKIVRAYAEHHSSNVITNLISLAAAVLAIRYYWWIDPTGAIIILVYTMNTWKKTFFENLFALIGRTAPPELLEKLTYLTLHHEDIKQIGRVRAYTFGSDQYFVEVDIVLPQDMVLSKTLDIVETLQVNLEKLPEVEKAFVKIVSGYTHRAEHTTMV